MVSVNANNLSTTNLLKIHAEKSQKNSTITSVEKNNLEKDTYTSSKHKLSKCSKLCTMLSVCCFAIAGIMTIHKKIKKL